MAERQRYFRAAEIAEELGVDVRTVRRWIKDGTLPSVKIGGARLVAEADLLRVLQPKCSAWVCSPSAQIFASNVSGLPARRASSSSVIVPSLL